MADEIAVWNAVIAMKPSSSPNLGKFLLFVACFFVQYTASNAPRLLFTLDAGQSTIIAGRQKV